MESYFYFPAELGEYDPQEHTMGYISEFRFIPNQVTTHCNSVLPWQNSCSLLEFFFKISKLILEVPDVLWFVDWSFVSFCLVVVVMPSLLSTKAVIFFFYKNVIIVKCYNCNYIEWRKKHSTRERWDAGFWLN